MLPHVRSGRVRALGVTSAARSPLLPDLPAIGCAARHANGAIAPLNREINAGLHSARMKAKLAELGTAPMVVTPEDFWAFAKGETQTWEKVIQRAGIKID